MDFGGGVAQVWNEDVALAAFWVASIGAFVADMVPRRVRLLMHRILHAGTTSKNAIPARRMKRSGILFDRDFTLRTETHATIRVTRFAPLARELRTHARTKLLLRKHVPFL